MNEFRWEPILKIHIYYNQYTLGSLIHHMVVSVVDLFTGELLLVELCTFVSLVSLEGGEAFGNVEFCCYTETS